LITREQLPALKVAYSSAEQSSRKYHFETTLNYDHAFESLHRIGGLVYYYLSDEQATTDLTSSLAAIPIRHMGLSSRLTYGYRDMYMIDVNFGYTGSENFIPG
jgi:hypothetical protein